MIASTPRHRQLIALLAAAVLAVAVLARCGTEPPGARPTMTSTSASTMASTSASADASTTASTGASTTASTTVAAPIPTSSTAGPALTPRQLAGQRIIYSYPGLTPPATLLRLIRNGEAAGVIFFGENIASSAQIGSVIRQLRLAQRQSPIQAPLLLMTDQEGGLIRRLSGPPVRSEKQIGQSSSPVAQASEAGVGAAGTLSAVGMNVNFAPVLDVYYSAGNFIDRYQRSYSSDPTTVATLGASFITAQQRAGVAATGKHFPGLGSVTAGQNTDVAPVTVTVSLPELRGRDELPYSAAIAAGVDLVMLSWAVYPALDPARPAGLSPKVVWSELRGRLRYREVTITDALEAGALDPFGTTDRRAVLAAQAGMDLILCSARDVGQGQRATDGLVAALADGRLGSSTHQAALDRIAALRAALR